MVYRRQGKANAAEASAPVAARGILTRINPEGLRHLALDRDTTVQALMIEAANDLLRKYRRRPVAQTAPRSSGGGAPVRGRRAINGFVCLLIGVGAINIALR